MTEFQKFSQAVHAHYMELGGKELFQVAIDKDAFYAAYLAAFPEGTNPIYRERTEHDCSCCHNFIKNLGTVVAVVNGVIETVWDNYKKFEAPYDVVGKALRDLLRKQPISGVYRTKEGGYGQEKTLELVDGTTKTWNHFYGTTYPRHRTDTPEAAAGELNTTAVVFRRGLEEITVSAVTQVMDLIAANNLYRGTEFLEGVQSFLNLKKEFDRLTALGVSQHFHWEHFGTKGARVRNTAIGTLLTDLSEGIELEKAVASFEKKVAPENYKRTAALITPHMINDAVQALEGLGLTEAIQRRHAKMGDITINNVLWASSNVRDKSEGGYLSRILLGSGRTKSTDTVADSEAKGYLTVSGEEFFDELVPNAASIEVLLKNNMANNLMSLTAPVNADLGQLFKWNNDFAWSYNGNVTDSIKERVKAAGGNTDAKLRVSLAWFNSDDLDIHASCPEGHVYFGNKMGILDVDMNAHGRINSINPVENLSWDNPRDGVYEIIVRQYNQRTNDKPGFVLEVENDGSVNQYSHTKAVRGDITAIRFNVKKGIISNFVVVGDLSGQGIQQEMWGMKTQQFVPVETLMLSPNYWDSNTVGNKHWFFILQGAKNDQPVWGIQNEFLNDKLHQHRKVFEVLGSQTMCPMADEQLSGLGFSSTRKDTIVVRVTRNDGAIKSFNVQF